jgi:hypothetical protein
MKIENLKNQIFTEYSIDNETNKFINYVHLINFGNSKKSRLLWSYYRDRSKINVNNIIKKYGRNNIIINYSIEIHK